MIRTDDKFLCSGCGVCSLVCPKACISYEPDVLGSLYAKIDSKTCIDCGVCQKVCPIQQVFDTQHIGNNAFAAYAKDENVRFRGSSGGMFETIGEWILKQNGSVFGARFDENLRLRMVEASTLDEVRKLTKSKYLQSDAAHIFPIIKARVKQGRTVLVCSTPCHISALKKYLESLNSAENLYLMDFFCHGVPSQDLFDRCINYIEHREGIKITSYEFRSKKKNGATPHYFTMGFRENGREKSKTGLYLNDPFYLGFQKYITLRDSCYRCPYGSGNHAGDITVGDFHNIDKYIKGINRFDGISTVIVNTDRGQKLWENISDSLVKYPVDLNQLHSDHQIYFGGASEPKGRSEFVRDMSELQFDQVVEMWFDSRKEWKKAIYYRLPRFIRDRIKSIVGL